MKKINEWWMKYKAWGKKNLLGEMITSLIQIILLAIVFFIIYQFLGAHFSGSSSEDSSLSDSSDSTNENCTVTGINFHGSLLTYVPEHADNDSFFDYDVTGSENILWAIKQAEENDQIKAILLEVDSNGGSPVAGEEVADALKHSTKPTVALIRESGVSAAYWAATGADRIFASKNSDVGDIGVTMSYLDNVNKNKKDGYTFEQLSAGKYKDYGNPDKPLTSEERALIQRDLNTVYKNFIAAVAENRKLPIADVQKIADGSSVLGEKAKSLGLIDEIGGMDEVEKYLEETIGEKPDICW